MKLRIKEIFNRISLWLNTMTFKIWIVIMLLSCGFTLIMDGYNLYKFKQELVDERTSDLQLKAATISAQVMQYSGNVEDNMKQISQAFEYFSEVYDARMLLLDSDFVVKLDTYAYEKNKTLISANVLEAAATGKNSNFYNKVSNSIEVAAPVKNTDGTIRCIVVLDRSFDDITKVTDNVSAGNSVLRVAVIMLLASFSFFVALLLTKPIKKITRRVNETNMGYHDVMVADFQYTELNELAEAFVDTFQKLKAEEESRQEFVSNVSHELKTPITSMKVLADSLNGQENVPVELYQEFMQDIVEEIDRESKIIDDLLSLVRLDKAAVNLNITSVSINDLLELILKRLRPIAQKKDVELVLESFRPVVAEVDEVKLTLAISNLVENAIKYNKAEEGWVHVSLNADHQYFYVRIEDSGIGIPQDSQKWVFDRFYRVDKARSRESGGTGLGLAIVKNCILLHRGDIKLHSEEDVGTTFTVRIPINYVAAKED